MRDSVNITVYRWAGKKWFLRIKGEYIECELTLSHIRTLVARNPNWPIEWEVKPWLTHIREALRHGGWHAPVLFVDGRLVRQGTVPTYPELEIAVRRALAKRGIPLARPPQKEGPVTDFPKKSSSCCA